MDRKKAIIIFMALILAIALFEFAFLYDFTSETGRPEIESGRQKAGIIFFIVILSFVPCILLGYAQMHPGLGFISPIVINGFFWVITTMNFRKSGIDPFLIQSSYVYLALGQVLVACITGIIFVALSSIIFKRYAHKMAVKKANENAD